MESSLKIRLPMLAAAIGATPKAVRHWVARYEIGAAEAPPNAWHQFSVGDVAVLAITKQLIDIGLFAPEAFKIARDKVLAHGEIRKRWARGIQIGMPEGEAIIHAVRKRLLVLTREKADAEWQPRISTREHGIDFILDERAAIFVDLELVVSEALERVGIK